MSEVLLKIADCKKSFGQNNVLKGVSFTLRSHEVTVLMGANGAGKSTLVKIISGFHGLTSGKMELDGQPFAPADAADAIRKGVVTVHQSIDDGVIPDLDVANNLMLDQLVGERAPLFVRENSLRARAQKIAASMDIEVDLRQRVAELSVADRQMIAIARAMAHKPKVLILDEPTSSLSASEANRLFSLIDRLKAQGVAILYISHRMSDIRRIADRILCMRDGEIAATFGTKPLDYEAAITSMLGHRMTDVGIEPQSGGEPVLSIEGLQLTDRGAAVDLCARDGEVVAIVGLLGSGKSKLAEVIFGMSPSDHAVMQLDGAPYRPKSVWHAVASGVFLSPKDRGANAVFGDFDIAQNMSLPFLTRFSVGTFLRQAQIAARTREMINQLGVVCQGETDSIGTLSGGNQQKVMIARWLMEPSRVLLLDEPFQGVDIGARRDIGRQIRTSAAGRATLVFMAEIDEALEIADRIVVMNEGAIVGEYINQNVNLSALVSDISGAQEDMARQIQ